MLLAGLILLAVPAVGSGYASQYAYWWLPLLVATYPLFDRGWRRLLVAFCVIVAATYIVEYGLLIDHGAFLIVNDHFAPGAVLNDAKLRFSQPTWLTVLRLPLVDSAGRMRQAHNGLGLKVRSFSSVISSIA